MSIKFLLKHVDNLKWVYKQEDELLAVWALATTRVIGFLQEKEETSALPKVGGMMWTQVKAGWESKFGFLKHTVSAFLPPLLLSPHILICASWNHVSNKPPAPKSLSQALLLGRSQTKTVSSTTRLSPSTGCTTALGSQGMEQWQRAGASARSAISAWANQRETRPSRVCIPPAKEECAGSRALVGVQGGRVRNGHLGPSCHIFKGALEYRSQGRREHSFPLLYKISTLAWVTFRVYREPQGKRCSMLIFLGILISLNFLIPPSSSIVCPTQPPNTLTSHLPNNS